MLIDYKLEYDFTGGTKSKNGAGVNLNLNEYQFNLYICGIHGSTILFYP